MKLACVILNYNDSDSVQELHGLIKEYESIDHIVIVDNCSTDDSYGILRGLEDAHTSVIRSDQNGGYGYGNNVGVRFAERHFGASHALIANPDVAFSNGTVEALKNAFLSSAAGDGKLAGAAPAVREGGKARGWKLPSAKELVLESSKAYQRLCSPKRYYPAEYFENKAFCKVDVVLGAMLMVDIAKMHTMGLYDESVFLFQEENMLGFQCKRFGFTTLVLPQEQYIHKNSVSVKKSIKSRINIEKIMFTSKLAVLKKYYDVGFWGIVMAKAFFEICLLEIRIYELLKRR